MPTSAIPTPTPPNPAEPGATRTIGAPTATLGSRAVATSPASPLPTPPPRDLNDLQRRLRPSPAPTASPATNRPAEVALGASSTFWVANTLAKNYFQLTARLAVKTDHEYWYVQDGVDLAATDVQSAASYFETQTYPTEHRLFGGERPVGINGDYHITFLVGHIPGVGGYFSTADEYPRYVNPYSNERQMIYINVDSVRPGSPGFNATLAHEFMHMIQFNVHNDQDAWINEGSAELAAQAVTGTTSSTVRAFEAHPDTQLTQWASEPADAVPHYGAAYLFMRYVAEQFGGSSTVGRLIAEPGRSATALDQLFQTLNPRRTFDDVFADWVAANVLDDPSLASGRYGYRDLRLNLHTATGPDVGRTTTGEATQFAATYYQIRPTQAETIDFRGSPTVQLIGGDPHDARYAWWSNRGDSIDTKLTRAVDLTSAPKATLSFWIWFDVEKGYDYGYVEASTDNGKTWATLPATDTTRDNPNGQNYGNGFTGTSGGKSPAWEHETVDLGPYAGRKILLRFEYVTDESYNADGFALDGIQIPEIGLADDASGDAGWQAEGFARIDNREPQPYLVELLDPSAPNPVQRVPIGPDGHGSVDLAAGQSRILVVAGLAPITIHQSRYELKAMVR